MISLSFKIMNNVFRKSLMEPSDYKIEFLKKMSLLKDTRMLNSFCESFDKTKAVCMQLVTLLCCQFKKWEFLNMFS